MAVIQAAGEDGVDDLHHNRHDVNEVGRRGTQSLALDDAVQLVYGLSVYDERCSLFNNSAYIYAMPNFAHETGIFWQGFRGPDCKVITEQGGGPDARLSWAGSGPRARGCPPVN